MDVIINIVNFNLFKCQEFRSEFCPLETRRGEPLTDKMSLRFFELRKLPAGQPSAGDNLLLWLALFKADTEEDLAKIKALEGPVMEQAISAYEKITATAEFRELERQRSYARHNEASALRHAREEGETTKAYSVARNALAEGASVAFVQRITGLDAEAINGLGAK